MIQLNNIIKRYKKYGKKRQLIFNNISKSFSENEMVFIVGAKKSGKTTFLNLLAGLDKLSFGSIYISNRILSFDNMKDIYNHRFNKVSYIFNGNNIARFETVGSALKKILKKKHGLEYKDSLLFDILKKLEIEHLKHKIQIQLTLKESQKVGLAVAMAKDTPIFLVDEPTPDLLKMIKEISRTKLVIVATTDEMLAKAYGSRVIYIENEKMERDISITTNTFYEYAERSVSIRKPDKHKAFNRLNLLTKTILLTILLLSFTLALFIASVDKVINSFDTYNAMIKTAESSESYVMPIYKYQERAYTYGWPFIIRAGTFDLPHDVKESYRDLINIKTDDALPLYASYFFNKSFKDFFDVQLSEIGLDKTGHFRSLHFTEVILVDDFSQFNEPLLIGTYPVGVNEVLIYDYMAEQIVTSGIDGLEDISDLLFYDFTDRDTGLMMTISGILKSKYGDYRYIETAQSSKIASEKIYLQSLQSIYTNPEFLNLVNLEGQIESTHEVIIKDYLNRELESNLDFRKIKPVGEIEDIQLIGNFSLSSYGFFISKHQLAELRGVDPSIIDADYVNSLNLNSSYTIESSQFIFDYSWNKSNNIKTQQKIRGVYDSKSLDLHTLYATDGLLTPFTNGNLRRFYLGLDENWDLNKEILESFKVPDSKSFIFFYENLEYSTDDFGVYSAHRLMAEETRIHVYDAQNKLLMYTFLSIIFMILSIAFYNHMVLPRDQVSIQVQRMSGRNNLFMVIKYGAGMMLIATLGSLIAYRIAAWTVLNFEEQLLSIKPYHFLNLSLKLSDLMSMFLWIFPIFLILSVLHYSIRLTQYPLTRIRRK
ncbi:MAG: ATP-binding cassette domain-containing protein [Acholeplasmataceae bacterium]|nr:ATP-binding cassette domain-containing protein [Acholeplasmataceae bacterium]